MVKNKSSRGEGGKTMQNLDSVFFYAMLDAKETGGRSLGEKALPLFSLS